jgi:threonine/homoserine/homoserine lactone efflux protein
MLAQAVPAALAAAIYPQALLFVSFLLGRPRPRQRALVFLSGAVVITLGVGFAVVLLLQHTDLEGPRHPTVSPWIDVAIGVALLVVAAWVALRPPRHEEKRARRRELGVLAVFGIGLVMYTPSPFYLASLHAIAEGHAGAVATTAGVVLVAVLFMLFVELPIAAHALWPEATLRTVRGANEWLSRHGRTLICLAAIALGGYLIITAVTRLT